MKSATISKLVTGFAAAVVLIANSPRLWAQEQDIVFGKSREHEQREQKAEKTQPEAKLPEAAQPDPGAVTTAQRDIKPRFELHVPSTLRLLSEARRSNSRFILNTTKQMIFEMGSASAEGVDVDQATDLLEQMGDWPDSSVEAAIFAPDLVGRLRWVARVDWPVEELRRRVQKVLESEAAQTLLEGVALRAGEAGGYEIVLLGSPMACLLPASQNRSYIASHTGLEIAVEPFAGTSETADDEPALVVCRLNLTGTEKDSGAGMFSQFRFVTGVEYAGRVDREGDWVETVHVHWPPLTGLGAKAALGKVKHSFFVPGEAFAAFAFQPFSASALLDGMAGFGPQMLMEASGEFEMVGEMAPGPIAKRGGDEACFAVLGGTGFLPVPDIVAQVRVRKPDVFIEEVREATQDINKRLRVREQPEPWTETEVNGRPVFWNDKRGAFPGMMMPFVMRPVIFTTKERDQEDRQKDHLVIAWTSTSPERFVQRWLDLPRNKDRHDLPSSRKTSGQGWINWKNAYGWLHPYINVALSATIRDTLLPRANDVAGQLNDAVVTLRSKYSGLNVKHRGPIPVGPLAVPIMVAFATGEDESGTSDLARERLASRRLKTFYHHCRLFNKDHRRWPAELAELDGYVDFQGHPELLRLKVSARKHWGDLFEKLDAEKEDDQREQDDEEDVLIDIDDKLFVIDWDQDEWRLGIAPGTLEHIQDLYIDQNGVIHRVVKEESQTLDAQPGEQNDS